MKVTFNINYGTVPGADEFNYTVAGLIKEADR